MLELILHSHSCSVFLKALSSTGDVSQILCKILLIQANKAPLNPKHSIKTNKLGQERAVNLLPIFIIVKGRLTLMTSNKGLLNSLNTSEVKL